MAIYTGQGPAPPPLDAVLMRVCLYATFVKENPNKKRYPLECFQNDIYLFECVTGLRKFGFHNGVGDVGLGKTAQIAF